MAVWRGLTNSCEKKSGEKQREKESYKHLNAEFQRMARRDKKAFLSDQCKEIEEKNRLGKTRDLFKKIRDTKGTFHAKMGSIKDRNCLDLTEAEDIKKRWQEYTEELCKKDLHNPDNHNGVIIAYSQTSWNAKVRSQEIPGVTWIKTIPKKKKCQEAKWLSVEAL